MRIGSHHSEETKLKMSAYARERDFSPEIRKRMSIGQKKRFSDISQRYWLGKRFSLEHRSKVVKTLNMLSGQSNPNWRGGKTPELMLLRNSDEAKLWRLSVFIRDNYTCQKCKKYGGILHAHHIKNFVAFPTLRFAIDNGMTLCKMCHIKFHKVYGKCYTTGDQLIEFLSNNC